MIKEDIINIIYRSTYCPEYDCENVTEECCRRCAEKQLEEYEKTIVISCVDAIETSLYNRLYLLKDEYDETYDNDVYMRMQELILCLETIDKYMNEGDFNV